MRWCTQTEADRPEGEPINYSPPSIIQSRPGALSACVYVYVVVMDKCPHKYNRISETHCQVNFPGPHRRSSVVVLWLKGFWFGQD